MKLLLSVLAVLALNVQAGGEPRPGVRVVRGMILRIETAVPRLIVKTESGMKTIVHVDLHRSWIQTDDDAFRSFTDLRVGDNAEIICEPDGAMNWAVLVAAWAGPAI